MTTDPTTPAGGNPPYRPSPPKYPRYEIGAIRNAIKKAERLGNREVFNYAEILRAAEDILKNADKTDVAQENARRRYLEVLADMDSEDVPAALRPVIGAAQAVLEGEDEKTK